MLANLRLRQVPDPGQEKYGLACLWLDFKGTLQSSVPLGGLVPSWEFKRFGIKFIPFLCFLCKALRESGLWLVADRLFLGGTCALDYLCLDF